jgi:hypothetical protein
MGKDTRIAFRASIEMKDRLAKACKKLKIGETALAEAAVEAAIEYVEEHGGIWFPLRVVPDPKAEAKTPNPSPTEFSHQVAQAAPIGVRPSGCPPERKGRGKKRYMAVRPATDTENAQ